MNITHYVDPYHTHVYKTKQNKQTNKKAMKQEIKFCCEIPQPLDREDWLFSGLCEEVSTQLYSLANVMSSNCLTIRLMVHV